ncbi:MAG: hypothetical protein AB7G28_20290 [Pirellulales bacterium]
MPEWLLDRLHPADEASRGTKLLSPVIAFGDVATVGQSLVERAFVFDDGDYLRMKIPMAG